METATITSALNGVKIATDAAHYLIESDASISKYEQQLKLAEIIGALTEVEIQLAHIHQQITYKDELIRDLKEKLTIKGGPEPI